jgi:uncharacterized protein
MIVSLVIALVCVIIAFIILFNVILSFILYHPSKEQVADPHQMISETNVSKTDVSKPAGSGKNDIFNSFLLKNETCVINGWFFKQKNSSPTLLICHGNAGNMSNRSYLIRTMYQLGINVCIYDYPGYGLSTGHPNEKGFYQSGEKVLQYLMSTLHIPQESIILLGESIGCGVAAYLAQKYQCSKLILISGFTSVRDMYDYLTRNWSILNYLGGLVHAYPVSTYLDQYKGHTMILHSRSDDIIPFEQAVQNAQHPRCQLVEIVGTHNYPIVTQDVLNKLHAFLHDIQK